MSTSDRKLILIVDDTPTNVSVVSGLLKDSYRTKVATNGERALAIVRGPEKPDSHSSRCNDAGYGWLRSLPKAESKS